jgi:phosphopantothenoylcysteine decarboxylase / phosphopantothenate---cysteine ligase
MQTEFPRSDLIVMAAAVGDFRPKFSSDRKLAKSELSLNLELELIPDILKDLSDRKSASQILVGFAAQTGTDSEILTIGRAKLFTKKLDVIAINSVNPNQSQNQDQTGFGSETNQAIFCHQDGRELRSPLCSKLELAHRLFDFLL